MQVPAPAADHHQGATGVLRFARYTREPDILLSSIRVWAPQKAFPAPATGQIPRHEGYTIDTNWSPADLHQGAAGVLLFARRDENLPPLSKEARHQIKEVEEITVPVCV